MKSWTAAASILAGLAPFAAFAANAPTEFTSNSYSSTCRLPYPLDTYERCDAYSPAGVEAARCAVNQALLDCRDQYNSDCIVQGVTHSEFISTEFIGYKGCQATARVHGYRISGGNH